MMMTSFNPSGATVDQQPIQKKSLAELRHRAHEVMSHSLTAISVDSFTLILNCPFIPLRPDATYVCFSISDRKQHLLCPLMADEIRGFYK